MKYFNSLPYLTNTDNNGNNYVLRNLLIRTNLVTQLDKNPLLFYNYELRDGDTPEIVANKYYGDPFRYWIVLFGNPNIMDPQWDWPLSSKQFVLYLNDKYLDAAIANNQTMLQYTQSTIHHYEKIITTYDDDTQTTAIKNIEVDLNTYNSIIPSTTTGSFSDGSKVKYTLDRGAISIYNYEYNVNEAKRNIKLINSAYVSDIEKQYLNLVGS